MARTYVARGDQGALGRLFFPTEESRMPHKPTIWSRRSGIKSIIGLFCIRSEGCADRRREVVFRFL
jgi:hypothetical protein